ncbi:MAG: glycosyltransferase family 4 protein [Candidatus Moranbacteria bacterium]|nr:glycosyltransferase family 4 protein [Candidatus Moranbacteria bacterium]
MSKENFKILFISRAYPPIFGGIENQNYGIANSLAEIADTKIIANKKGKKNLPLFIPYIFIYLLFNSRKYDVILFGDGVLAPLGQWVKWFNKKTKFASIVHGLDITYAYKKSLMGKIYRAINIPALKKLDKLIAVGNYTVKESIKIGIKKEKCIFIPNGIYPDEYFKSHTREELAKLIDMNLTGKKVIFRMGRFVPHKGVHWFIEKVMPKLPENFVFIAMGGRVSKSTAGDEDSFVLSEKAVKKNNLENRVRLLTNLTDKEKTILFNTTDLVVSPNIDIHGSMEGFGINAIETGVCERVVLSADFQGLKDAVIDGKNGFMVPHENAEAWIGKVNELLSDDFDRVAFGKKTREFNIKNFSWEIIAKKYLDVLRGL